MNPGRLRSGRATRVLGGAAIAAAVVVGIAAPVAMAKTTAAAHGGGPPAKYYLALGDSLAQGVQPDPATGVSAPTNQGYANDLYSHYEAEFPGNLQLVKLGCPGETTTSMLTGTGSPCTYAQGSQLAAALAFIKAHRSAVSLITVDIGANNVDGCATAASISPTCIANGIGAAESDLPKILGELRSAAGDNTVIAGMNLYDPFLADYLTGATGRTLAQESVGLASTLNSVLQSSDAAIGAKTADVQTAFSTDDFTDTAQLPGAGTVPLNVANICEWTWMCAPAPAGPNIHANATGYQQIATAFEQAIGTLH